MAGCSFLRCRTWRASGSSSMSSSPVMAADRVVIVWPEIGDYLSILPTSAKSVFSAPFLSRTISGEKSGNNRKGSLSLKRVIKLMIRGGAAAGRSRQRARERAHGFAGREESTKKGERRCLDDGNSGNRPSRFLHCMQGFFWRCYLVFAISHSFALSVCRRHAQGNDLPGLAGRMSERQKCCPFIRLNWHTHARGPGRPRGWASKLGQCLRMWITSNQRRDDCPTENELYWTEKGLSLSSRLVSATNDVYRQLLASCKVGRRPPAPITAKRAEDGWKGGGN